MQSTRKTRWQQATALVSLSTCGAMTGISFAHGNAADLTSPSSVPVKLLALNKPARSPAAGDSALRAAIVKAARYYLNLAQSRSPSEMEALIWQNDSTDGVDHGESCAAFASLTLESGAQAAGQQSWVTGGTTYPWPVHAWVVSRVDPNPDSPGVVSVLQAAEANHRWHPVGDGYTPQPGDWVLFDGHVEVVTGYADGVLDTIGGDSLPNMSVNAHQYDGPLAAQGVTGFVNNGVLLSAVRASSGGTDVAAADQGEPAQADIPGLVMPALSLGTPAQAGSSATGGSAASGPVLAGTAMTGTAVIPGALPVTGSVTSNAPARSAPRYSRSQVTASAASAPGTTAQQAFISKVAPGALAAQRQYGIPAAVTIAQAIDESGWGQSQLATQDNNLFGIKGSGPAGSVLRPTQEYENGQPVTVNAEFRAYNSVSQSITDHSLLLATGSAYQHAMTDRRSPDAFANALTGVYATDPSYGTNLITIMRQYNLYRFDAGSSTAGSSTAGSSTGSSTAGRDSSAASRAARGASGHGSPGPSGAAKGTSALSGATQAAVIPGAVEVGAGGLGIPAQQGPGRSTAGHGVSGPAGKQRDGAKHGAVARRGAAPGLAAGNGGTGPGSEGSGQASIPGLDVYAGTAATSAAASTSAHLRPAGGQALRAGPRNVRVSTRRYVAQVPRIVTTDFIATAKTPLLRAKPMYQDVAADSGIRWELLAACDWMQCHAQPRVSPVHGEKLGTKNSDGTVYRTKSEALEQVTADLIELAAAVYGINLRQRLILSVRDLANVFAAFRWGGLLKAHRISAMEFPYSVEGLTAHHLKMRWPDIGEAAPDKPGARFRMSFGAVPVVLGLNYPAVA